MSLSHEGGPRQYKIPEVLRIEYAGGHRIRVTPVPIPNTEVKPDTADGTAWETAWESRSLPALFSERPDRHQDGRAFFIADLGLRIADCGLRIGDCGIVDCGSRVADCDTPDSGLNWPKHDG